MNCEGQMKDSFLLSLSRQIVFLIPAMFLLGSAFGINGLLCSRSVSDILSGVVSIAAAAAYWKKYSERVKSNVA